MAYRIETAMHRSRLAKVKLNTPQSNATTRPIIPTAQVHADVVVTSALLIKGTVVIDGRPVPIVVPEGTVA